MRGTLIQERSNCTTTLEESRASKVYSVDDIIRMLSLREEGTYEERLPGKDGGC